MKVIRLKLQKGFAIPFVAFLFLILFPITGIMYNLLINNLHLAIAQERNIQAYYVAMTGIEMGTAALFTDPGPSVMATISLLDYYKSLSLSEARIRSMTETVALSGPGGIPMGSVVITISAPVKPGAPTNELWIRVEAIGTHFDASGDPRTVGVHVWYSAENPAIFEQDHVIL